MRSVDILIGLDINEHHGVISSSLSRTGLQLRRDRRQDRLVLGGLCPPEKDQRQVNWARPGRLPRQNTSSDTPRGCTMVLFGCGLGQSQTTAILFTSSHPRTGPQADICQLHLHARADVMVVAQAVLRALQWQASPMGYGIAKRSAGGRTMPAAL
jgi:hypothetical protein